MFDGLYAFDFGSGTSPVMDGFQADHAQHDLQPRPRLRAEGRPDLARLRRPATGPAVSGLHLHRARRAGRGRAQRQVPGVREHRQPVRVLGRVPGVSRAGDPGRRQARGDGQDGLRPVPGKVLPLLERRRLSRRTTRSTSTRRRTSRRRRSMSR